MKQFLVALVLSLASATTTAADNTYISMLLDAYDVQYMPNGHPLCDKNLTWQGLFSPKNKLLALCTPDSEGHVTLKHELVHVAQWCESGYGGATYMGLKMPPLALQYALTYADAQARKDDRFEKGSMHYFVEMEAEGIAVSTPLCKVIELVQERCVR
jgi:hypothetical protein